MNYKDSPYFKDYENTVNELNSYRSQYPMTNEEGNDFRHLAGSAVMAREYGVLTSNILGLAKEYDDYFNKHKGLRDSLGDIKNNLYGSIIGQFTPPFIPRHNLYNYILNTSIRGGK